MKQLEAVFTLFLPTPFRCVAVRNSLEKNGLTESHWGTELLVTTFHCYIVERYAAVSYSHAVRNRQLFRQSRGHQAQGGGVLAQHLHEDGENVRITRCCHHQKLIQMFHNIVAKTLGHFAYTSLLYSFVTI